MTTKQHRDAAFAALGIRPITVRGPSWDTMMTSDESIEQELIDLKRPWIRLWEREGMPPVLLCGDTRTQCQTGQHRSGPNGPIDGATWIRVPPGEIGDVA